MPFKCKVSSETLAMLFPFTLSMLMHALWFDTVVPIACLYVGVY